MPGLKEKSYPSDKEIREFWEWVGWEFTLDGNYWRVSSQASGWGPLATLPPIDLNSLFKYAVPKLLDMERSISVTVDVARSGAIVRDKFDKTPAIWREEHRDNPALALFWAIHSLITSLK